MRTYTDEEIIEFDPYADECEVKYSTVKIVTTRKEHFCFSPLGTDKCHTAPVGTRMRYESAQVDGVWGKYYTCVDCIAAYMNQIEDEDDE